MELLEKQSHINEEYLLDVLFSAEEVFNTVLWLKVKKVPGPDGLVDEHLKLEKKLWLFGW